MLATGATTKSERTLELSFSMSPVCNYGWDNSNLFSSRQQQSRSVSVAFQFLRVPRDPLTLQMVFGHLGVAASSLFLSDGWIVVELNLVCRVQV